jgi:hypothetical protein
MIYMKVIITADLVPIFTLVWDGVLIIHGTTAGITLGMIHGIMADGIARGITADGTIRGITVSAGGTDGTAHGTTDGIRLGIMAADGTIHGITEEATLTDFMTDFIAA